MGHIIALYILKKILIASFRSDYFSLFIYDRKPFRKEKELKYININRIEKIDGANCVNNHYVLKDNTNVFCCLKLKIIRIKINYDITELIQNLERDKYCSQFYNCFEFNNSLVSSTDKGIIIWKKKRLYIFKLNISIGNITNISFINENIFSSNNIPKGELIFYDNNYKEILKIENIFTWIDPLRMAMINKNILAIYRPENNSIYLIDIINKKLIKEDTLKDYNSKY